MKRQSLFTLLLAALLLCCCAVPAGAVILEVTVKGTISTMTESKNTLTIAYPQQYGCSYPAGGGDPVCTWSTITDDSLSGTVPDPAAFSVFAPKDYIIATSLGGAGGTWISLAKLYGTSPNENYITDIVGDLPLVDVPLAGNYTVDAVTTPNCSACTGTTCTASSSYVKIKSGTMVLTEKSLAPGGVLQYNGQNDGSSISVQFVSGQASSATCPGTAGLVGGVQPVSDYIVKVAPPLSLTQHNIRTATTTSPSGIVSMTMIEAPATPAPTAVTTAAPVATTQKSATLPFAAAGALVIVALAGVLLRR